MDGMRRFERIVFFVILVPAFAAAATAPTADFSDPDVCRSNRVVIEKGEVKVEKLETSSYKSCSEFRAKGYTDKQLEAAKVCGSVSFAGVSSSACPYISKCLPKEEFQKRTKECLAGALRDNVSQSAVEDIGRGLSSENPDDRDAARTQLSNVLAGVGVGEEDRTKILASPEKTKDAYEMLLAQSKGDIATAKDIAVNKLGLNEELSTNIVQMSPEKFTEKLVEGGALDKERLESAYSVQTTFSGDPASQETSAQALLDRAKCAIATIESGSCQGNYGTIGPPTRTGNRAVGKYQVMDFNVPSWTAQACGRAYTPWQFRADPGCQEAVFERIYGGYITQCGGYEAAAAKWFTGRCAPPGSANDMYLSASGYVSKFSRVFSGNSMPFGSTASMYSRTGSPFAAVSPWNSYQSDGLGGYYSQNSEYCIVGTSPLVLMPCNSFVNRAAPVGTSGYGTPTYPSQGNSYGGGSVGIPGGQQIRPVSGQILPGQTLPPGGAPPVLQPVEPVATIIVQPPEVVRGNPMVVSWSTVGMSVTEPCRVYVRSGGTNVELARANEGTRTLLTSATSTPGVWIFALQCISQKGSVEGKEATISVR